MSLKIDEIIREIQTINVTPNSNSYTLIPLEDEYGPFFGKNSAGNICFVVQSYSAHPRQNSRNTKELVLILDIECGFDINGEQKEMLSNILVCKSRNESDIAAFIRLCTAFSSDDLNSRSIVDLFSALTRLFSTKRPADANMLIGLVGELYTIYFFENMGTAISKYWQKKDLMKFDFTISPTKKMEVKTALGSERKHHFKHEQLYYEDYDIMIVSVMLRSSNQGISAYDLVDYCRKLYSADYDRLNIIENRISNFSDEDLKEVVYDQKHLEDHIEFIPATNVPRFKEKSPNNLSNAEYDCVLEGCIDIEVGTVKSWIRSGGL
jgi:hypothetical protein